MSEGKNFITMEEITSQKVLPTANIQSVIHPDFPTISKVAYVDNSIEDTITSIIYPETSDILNLSNLEFNIFHSVGYYVNLASLALELKIEILDGDGARANIDAAADTYFLNNALQTMFSTKKVYLNNTPVETNYHNSHLSYLNQLLYTDNESIVLRGLAQGAFPIKSGTMSEVLNADHMGRMVERKTFSKQATVHLKGPLNLDLSTGNKFLIDGVNIRIILEPQSSEFFINAKQPGAGAVAYRYKINYARLYVQKIKPSNGAFIATTKSLISSNMEYLFRRNVVHSELFSAGQNTLIINRPFLSKIPAKLYIFMVKQTADNGNYEANAQFFPTCDISNINVLIDGNSIVDQDTDVASGLINTYYDSFVSHGDSTFIPYEVYTKGAFVICVKTVENNFDQLSVEKRGNLSIKLRLGADLADTHVVYIVGSVDSVLEINADREVFTNYSY